MAFQTKNFTTIVLGMINRAKALQSKITDFRIGSVARTLFESPAAEIDELYQQMWIGLKEAIPVAIYNSFDFAALAAQPATGLVRVSIAPASVATVVGAGSVFAPVGYSTSFVTRSDFVIPIGGSYVDCFVEALAPGAVGSVVSGTPFNVSPVVPGAASVVALASFSSGSDLESEDRRKARFGAYILTLNRGTPAALRYGLSLAVAVNAAGDVIESAVFTKIIEPYLLDPLQPVALVNCYIHNGVAGASSALIADAQKKIAGYTDINGVRVAGWKAAGVQVTVQAATDVPVAITGVITLVPGYVSADVIAAVQASMGEYVLGLDIGADALRAELIGAAMSIDGVANFILTVPAVDAAITDTQKAAVGAYTLTAV